MLKKMWLLLVNFRRWAASMRSRTVSSLAHMITTAKRDRTECYLSVKTTNLGYHHQQQCTFHFYNVKTAFMTTVSKQENSEQNKIIQ